MEVDIESLKKSFYNYINSEEELKVESRTSASNAEIFQGNPSSFTLGEYTN